MNKNVITPPGDGRRNHPNDFSSMEDTKPENIEAQVHEVLSGKKSLGEVSPLVKTVLRKMRR